jgi:hypothetical protein
VNAEDSWYGLTDAQKPLAGLKVSLVPLPGSSPGELYTYGARRRVTLLGQSVAVAAFA